VNDQISYLGTGAIGGKATGLKNIQSILKEADFEYSPFEVQIPKMVVLRTSIFDEFMSGNELYDIALSDNSDEYIGMAFQKATLPFSILGELRRLVSDFETPIVVRSSSLMEDAKAEPFAGVYGTKMTPNNQVETDVRFNKLVEAIKFVYASTFFKNAKDYFTATRYDIESEKMAVIIQEVIGTKHGGRFYPELSGVIKSYNYYSTSGGQPEDGIVHLAIGLGKEIVDGGVSWSFTPADPLRSPPFKSTDALLKNTQLRFYSVNIGEPPPYDPVSEKEFLHYQHINTAIKDGTLQYLVSTYSIQSNRIWDGPKGEGAKIANFKPLLKSEDFRISTLLKQLMHLCESAHNNPVEIEFAVRFSKDPKVRHLFAFLQVRPMNVSDEVVNINDEEKNDSIVYSKMVLGNGRVNHLRDMLVLKPTPFNPENTSRILKEISAFNEKMISSNTQYILYGHGRWGTTDEWAGIPVDWSQISGAKVIIESALEGTGQQMSQASHFFHNIAGFKVLYFSLPSKSAEDHFIKQDRIEQLEKIDESDFLVHYKVDEPFEIKVDGRTGIGLIK
jgi:hypothetical protein